MEDLIKALQIFQKYDNSVVAPICCKHKMLHICVPPERVSFEDSEALKELSFHSDGVGGFNSYRFGSC